MTTEEIALQVAKEWQMAFGGVELDFALEVAKRAVESEREACAKAAEGFTDGRDDRKWVPGSLYDTLRRETAAFIRKRSNVELTGQQRPCGATPDEKK